MSRRERSERWSASTPLDGSGVQPHADRRARLDELLVAAGRGDERAYGAVYDEVIDMVYGLACKVLRDRSMAEDVAQTSMVDLWRQAPRFDPAKGSALAFVSTIAHRRAVDRVRSEAAHQRRAERAMNEVDTGPAEPDDVVIDDLDRRRVSAAMAALTVLQRQSIELAFSGGYTHLQIADILQLPLGTVKTRIRDGLIRLRDALGADA